MKKTFIILVGLMLMTSVAMATVTTLSYVSPADVSVTRMESNRQTLTNAANALDGALVSTGTIPVTAMTDNARTDKRWDEGFSDWVYTGLTIPTSASLSATTTLGTAYISGTRLEKDATPKTYTTLKWTFVDLSSTGVYTYTEAAIGASDPAITADSIRIARVSSDGTTINAIRDDRVTGVTLGSEQENFQRENFTITVVTPETITLSPGIVYHGTTRIIKTADTTLSLGTAADFATGGGSRANTTKGYVVVNATATQFKLTTTAPTVTDVAGNSAGELRYSVISSENWRVLDWFWMDDQGSGNLRTGDFGAWPDNMLPENVVQTKTFQTSTMATGTTVVVNDDSIPQNDEGNEFMTIPYIPVNALNVLKIEIVMQVALAGTNDALFVAALFQDSTADAIAAINSAQNTTDGHDISFSHTMIAGTVGETTFKVRVGSTTGGTITFNGAGSARKLGGVMASSITITEYKQGV